MVDPPSEGCSDAVGSRKTALAIGLKVLNVLKTDCNPDHTLMNPRLFPLLLRQPTMGGRSRVNDRSLRITEVSSERHQYRRVDKLPRRFTTTRHFECQHSAVATLLARRQIMSGMI